jgi:uncharacterized membrane protein
MSDAPEIPAAGEAPASEKRLSRWLYASLGLNLLLVGLLVGVTASRLHHRGPFGFEGHRPPPMAVRDVGFAFMRALPEERRKELRALTHQKFGGADVLFAESMKARAEAFDLLDDETVDAAKLKAAFAKIREADAQAQVRAGDAFAEIVAGLPAAERRTAIAKVQERWRAREDQRGERGKFKDKFDDKGEGEFGPPPPPGPFSGPPPGEGAPPPDEPPHP